MKNYWLIRSPKISLIKREDKKIIIHFKSGSKFEFWENLDLHGRYISGCKAWDSKHSKEWDVAKITAKYIFSILPTIRIREKSYYIDSITQLLEVRPLKLQIRGMIHDAIKYYSPYIREIK